MRIRSLEALADIAIRFKKIFLAYSTFKTADLKSEGSLEYSKTTDDTSTTTTIKGSDITLTDNKNSKSLKITPTSLESTELISINHGFDYKGSDWNFKRDYYNSLGELDAEDISSFPDGFITTVYQYGGYHKYIKIDNEWNYLYSINSDRSISVDYDIYFSSRGFFYDGLNILGGGITYLPGGSVTSVWNTEGSTTDLKLYARLNQPANFTSLSAGGKYVVTKDEIEEATEDDLDDVWEAYYVISSTGKKYNITEHMDLTMLPSGISKLYIPKKLHLNSVTLSSTAKKGLYTFFTVPYDFFVEEDYLTNFKIFVPITDIKYNKKAINTLSQVLAKIFIPAFTPIMILNITENTLKLTAVLYNIWMYPTTEVPTFRAETENELLTYYPLYNEQLLENNLWFNSKYTSVYTASPLRYINIYLYKDTGHPYYVLEKAPAILYCDQDNEITNYTTTVDDTDRIIYLKRDITTDRYTSICLPCTIPSDIVTSTFGENTSILKISSINDDLAISTEPVDSITAGLLYLIKAGTTLTLTDGYIKFIVPGTGWVYRPIKLTVGDYTVNSKFNKQYISKDYYTVNDDATKLVLMNKDTPVKGFSFYITK